MKKQEYITKSVFGAKEEIVQELQRGRIPDHTGRGSILSGNILRYQGFCLVCSYYSSISDNCKKIIPLKKSKRGKENFTVKAYIKTTTWNTGVTVMEMMIHERIITS